MNAVNGKSPHHIEPRVKHIYTHTHSATAQKYYTRQESRNIKKYAQTRERQAHIHKHKHIETEREVKSHREEKKYRYFQLQNKNGVYIYTS